MDIITNKRFQKNLYVTFTTKIFIVFLFLLFLTSCTSTHQNRIETPVTNVMSDKSENLEARWGVELQPIRLTAAGYMIDFRYRVTDPKKAAQLLSRNVKRYVIVEKSKAVLQVPTTDKLGALRSAVSTPEMVKKDRIYAALFANPGRHVKSGDKITIVVGEFKAENLEVH